MKMNKFFMSLCAAAAILGFASCNDDFGKEPNNQTGVVEDENTPSVYVGVNFSMPSSGMSRSFTNGDDSSNDGVEVGSDAENNVNEVLLVLASPDDYSLIASATIHKKDIFKHGEDVTSSTSTYHAKAKFTKTQLSNYYLKGSGSEEYVKKSGEILVFVIVNPSGKIVENVAKADFGNIDWIQTTGSVIAKGINTEGSIWTANNFLMSNNKLDIRFIPEQFTDWNKYSTSSHYYNLSADNEGSTENHNLNNASNGGAIDVVRVAARMDFKDGSQLGNCTYNVIFEDDENGLPDETKPLINIYLNKMCLVNMSNSFYYLKRVSKDGLDEGAPKPGATTFNAVEAYDTYGWLLCGAEKPWYSNANGEALPNSGNYIVDTYAQMKKDFSDHFPADAEKYPFDYLSYFNYPFFDPNGELDDNTTQGSSDIDERWYISQISDVLKGESDLWKNKEYHVWRYLTENTIPGPSGNQVNGISTGVVFKGKMLIDGRVEKWEELPEDVNSVEYFNKKAYNDLIDAINMKTAPNVATDPILYSVGGDIYAGWENVRLAAIFSSLTYTLSPDQTQIIVDWNRENSLYQAVFGTGGTGYSFTAKVKDVIGGTIGEDDENSTIKDVIYTDPVEIDPSSPAALWSVWDEKGRPADGPEIIAFKKAATGNDITIYQRSTDNVDGAGYYCYYYYWNRHNDNGNNGVMGPMEFAVVRNNVYKLSVTSIEKLGHPRVPLNDPESPTPKTPDEKENVYLTVDAKVLPWVVRVNNIEFK